MPRIEPFVDPPERLAAELLELSDRDGAPDERMVRVLGRSIAGAWWLRAWHVALFEGLLPHRLKELVRIRMSVAIECGYCSSVLSKRAVRDGMTQDIVLELVDFEQSTELDEQEKAALRYADIYMSADENLLDSDDLFAELRRHFSDDEIIELSIMCSFLHGGGKFAKALQVVTWAEACEVNPALAGARAGADVA